MAASEHGRRLHDSTEAHDAVLRLAQNVRALRKDRGLKLEELARRCGLSVSSLSKIENRQMSPTFDTLVALAGGFGIDVGQLVSPSQQVSDAGRRSISRQGQGVKHETPVYDYTFLCSEITNKKFVPLLTTIKAGSIEAFPALSAHEGEEFFYVLSGTVILHTDHYTPAELSAGDCIYFSSAMGHALLSAGRELAKVLWIASSLQRFEGTGHSAILPDTSLLQR